MGSSLMGAVVIDDDVPLYVSVAWFTVSQHWLVHYLFDLSTVPEGREGQVAAPSFNYTCDTRGPERSHDMSRLAGHSAPRSLTPRTCHLTIILHLRGHACDGLVTTERKLWISWEDLSESRQGVPNPADQSLSINVSGSSHRWSVIKKKNCLRNRSTVKLAWAALKWLTQTRQLNMLESDSHVSFGDSGCGKLSRQLNLCKSKFLEVWLMSTPRYPQVPNTTPK